MSTKDEISSEVQHDAKLPVSGSFHHQYGNFSLLDVSAFAEWVAYNYVRLSDCWVHKYQDQRNKDNWKDTPELFKWWFDNIKLPTAPTNLKFGDMCLIEQKRYGSENEQYIHKVVGTLKSNTWVDVPVTHIKEVRHDTMEDVVACITCGVSEREVLRYRIADVRKK